MNEKKKTFVDKYGAYNRYSDSCCSTGVYEIFVAKWIAIKLEQAEALETFHACKNLRQECEYYVRTGALWVNCPAGYCSRIRELKRAGGTW